MVSRMGKSGRMGQCANNRTIDSYWQAGNGSFAVKRGTSGPGKLRASNKNEENMSECDEIKSASVVAPVDVVKRCVGLRFRRGLVARPASCWRMGNWKDCWLRATMRPN